MRKNKLNIAGFVLLASLMSACSLNYDPISEYSDVTIGAKDEEGSEIAFKNREEALNQYESIYKRMRDNQENGIWITFCSMNLIQTIAMVIFRVMLM